MDMEDEEIEAVKLYFTKKDWNEMGNLEQTRAVNQYKNYLAFKDHVPNAEDLMPSFMQREKSIQMKSNKQKRKRVGNNKENYEPRIKKIPVSTQVSERPKRKIARVNYTEEEEPSSDRYIYCEKCKKVYLDFCPKCGILYHIKDENVPLGTVNRAKLTVPKDCLEIRNSTKHGYGVFAIKSLPKDIRFGPYEGTLIKKYNDSSYSWMLRGYGLLDGADESKSNWLRYVNCANHSSEQNLIAFQYNANIYYRTARLINPGDELLVYYGNSFAKLLGLAVELYFKPQMEELQKIYSCEYCCFGFIDKEYQIKHMLRCQKKALNNKEYKGDIFKCKYCPITVSCKEFLMKHEKCCKNKNIEREKVDVNKNVVEDAKKHKCKICNYSTNYFGDFRKHMFVHNGIKNFQCDYCNYKCTQKGNLKSHVNAKHAKMEKYFCNQCTYTTYYTHALKTHKRIHDMHKFIFICDICNKGFNQNGHIKQHMYKHNNVELPFKCQYCDYRSTSANNVKTHENDKHTKKYLHKCNKCQYSTTQKSKLKTHMYTHEKEKPLKCLKCQYQCIQNKHLKRHNEIYH